MKLKGILDISLVNFLCLRGFAPMGVLQDIFEAPTDIQRRPKDGRLKELGDYLFAKIQIVKTYLSIIVLPHMVSDHLRLEVLPKPTFRKHQEKRWSEQVSSGQFLKHTAWVRYWANV